MARRSLVGVAQLLMLGGCFAQTQPPSALDQLRSEMSQLSKELTALKEDPAKADLEKQKLRVEIAKLQGDYSGTGQLLAWLQGLGIGSVIGGVLVWLAGRSLGAVQQEKLLQEMEISSSQHNLKLFEALGSADPRIRLGAASELGQRYRHLTDRLVAPNLTDAARGVIERERQAIVRVLIAVTKHEGLEDLQKHIADLIVDLLDARKSGHTQSPLCTFDFQGAKFGNAWWKGIDARGVDFYKAQLPRAGLAESKLSKAIFKGANLADATLRGAIADEANFEGATLTGLKAKNAKFVRANLKNSVVDRADFSNADFTGADVTGVDFSTATKTGAVGLP